MKRALASALVCALLAGCANQVEDDLTVALRTTWVPAQSPHIVDWGGLADGSNNPVAPVAGRWTWVLLGYTSCPDVCPTGLKGLGALLRTHDVDGVFVSVDPARDSGLALDEYARWFHPRMRAATGSASDLGRLADSLGGSFSLPDDRSGSYAVEHSVAAFLLDPSGRLAGVSARPADATSLRRDHELAVDGGVLVPSMHLPTRPPGARALAAYGSLVNSSPRPRVVVQVRSPDFEKVEFHRTQTQNGSARMDRMNDLVLPASSTVALSPGGLHLMLFEPVHPVADAVSLEFVLEDGTVVPVRAATGPG